MARSLAKTILSCVIALALVACWTAQAWAETRELMIPARDGAKLSTNVFLPSGNGPWPVVLSRTPYGKGALEGGERREANFLTNGYVRVVQDVRGKGGSEG